MANKKRAGKINVSQSDVSQKIDLKKYMKDIDPKKKQLFAELAIEEIEQRSLNGKNINGKKFKKYTKKYADLKGVTRDNVDMLFKGDMLDSLDTYKGRSKGDDLTIGIKGSKQKKKANNHMTPKSNDNPLPQRAFFGLTDKEARKIGKKVERELGSDDEIVDQQIQQEVESFTRNELLEALNALGIQQVE